MTCTEHNDTATNRLARESSGRPEPEAGTRPVDTAYAPPQLERLGAWRALTLQQSTPIGPGTYIYPSRLGGRHFA